MPFKDAAKNKAYQAEWVKKKRLALKEKDPEKYEEMLERRRLNNKKFRASKKGKEVERKYQESGRRREVGRRFEEKPGNKEKHSIRRYKRDYGNLWEVALLNNILKERIHGKRKNKQHTSDCGKT